MELRHLRYFVVVAEELHFTRAAERLHIGQPPLSQQIHALETELGVQLFERDKRNVKLTEAGEYFLVRAQKILADARKAAEEAQRVGRGEIGELRIGFTASLPLTPHLASVLQTFHVKFPEVTLTLGERFTRDQFNALRHDEIDVGFVRDSGDSIHPGIHLDTLFRDPLMVVIPERHPLFEPAGLMLEQLQDEDFICYPGNAGSGLSTVLGRLFRAAHFQPKITQIAVESITQIGLVAAGLGIAILPSPLACVHIEGVRYIPLRDEGAYLTMKIATREHEKSALVQHFRQCCMDSIC